MLQNILKKIGYIKESEHQTEITKLKFEIKALTGIVQDLQKKQERLDRFDIYEGDPSPTDVEQRKEYVAQVAGLHKDIIQPKLKFMIANCYKQLEAQDNERDFDMLIKGWIFALKGIDHWGNIMIGEHIANMKNGNGSDED